jgi:hypothetical protein
MWGIIPVLNWSLGAPTVFDYHQISLIPLAYMVGLVPALLAGVFDGILARRNIGYRVLWCALFGYAMSFIPLLSSLSMGFLHGPFVLMFGLLGAVPGAVCSWIVGVNSGGRHNAEFDTSPIRSSEGSIAPPPCN